MPTRRQIWLARRKPIEIYEGDRPTGVECPRPDCDLIVFYNGNYFCACGWSMCAMRDEKLATMPDLLEHRNRLYRSMGVEVD